MAPAGRDAGRLFAYVLVTAILLVVSVAFLSVGIEALRDWLDARSAAHAIAVGLGLMGVVPALLLPLDLACSTGAALPRPGLAALSNCSWLAIWVSTFVVAPGALNIAKNNVALGLRHLVPAFWASLPSALLGVCFALLGPALAVAPLPPPPRRSWTASWVGGVLAREHSWEDLASLQSIRLALVGPLALWLLGGCVTLAMHAAVGAAELPALLAPPTRTHVDPQLARLQRTLNETHEELRQQTSAFLLTGRKMSRAQQDHRQQLLREKHRLSSQVAKLEQRSSGCSHVLSRARVLRALIAAMLLPPAILLGVSLAVGLSAQASLSSCAAPCGFLVAPSDLRHRPTTATPSAAASLLDLMWAADTERLDTLPPPPSPPPPLGAAALGPPAAVTPLDALLLLASSRAAPLDAVLVFLLLILVLAWVVAAQVQDTSAPRPQGSSPLGSSTAGGTPTGDLEGADGLTGGHPLPQAHPPTASSTCVSAGRPSRMWAVRVRGSSAAALVCLSVRLALSAVAFAFLLLTVAPAWSQWDQPGLGLREAHRPGSGGAVARRLSSTPPTLSSLFPPTHELSSTDTPPEVLSPLPSDIITPTPSTDMPSEMPSTFEPAPALDAPSTASWEPSTAGGSSSPPEVQPASPPVARPTRRLSMARATLLLLTQRLPFFGIAWFGAQALVAASFALCLSRQLFGMLGVCVCRRAGDEKGVADAERMPLCPKR